jgi:hypothetical protein
VLVTQAQTAQVVLGIGRIDRHYEKLFEFRRDDAAFFRTIALQLIGEFEPARELGWIAIRHRDRLCFREDGRTGVPLLDR